MIYVGRFNEEDLKKGKDKIEVKKAMEKHNLKYTNTKLVQKSNKIIGIDIWVCDENEFTI